MQALQLGCGPRSLAGGGPPSPPGFIEAILVIQSTDLPDAPYIKPDRPSAEQIAAWRRMTYGQKLEVADSLRSTAIRLREGRLRQEHPELAETEIRRRVRELILHGGA